MASRHQRNAPVYEYQPFHVTATGTLIPVGKCVATTSSAAITAGLAKTVTPTSMKNIEVGMYLNLNDGTQGENVLVQSITATTFKADLLHSYASGINIISRRGTNVGSVTINTTGTTDVITLYNGHPSALPDPGAPFAVITASNGDHTFNCACDKGLYYTVAGTPGDYTIMYLDEAA